MSIQEAIAKKRGKPSLILRALNRLSQMSQKTSRLLHRNSEKVYYPYSNLLHTHPFFSRYYKFPPLNYSNLSSARLCHWVTSVPSAMKQIPYVIEPQDHPLAVTGKLEPRDALAGVEKATEVYMSPNCKRILVESEGQLALFKRYLPEAVISKIEIVRLGAMAQRVNIEKKLGNLERPVFLCLASDYKRKGVDLLIQAWKVSSAKSKCSLILACPNIPPEMWNSLEKENVKIIHKAPLSTREKFKLHSSAHVVIAPLHVDGGSNVIEAFEHGLPVITMRSQRSFIREGSGWEVDVPFYFYDEGYGKEWPTWDCFWTLLEDAKKNHAFDITVQGFVNIFDDIAKSPERLVEMGRASYELSKGEFSLENRNAALRKIYRGALQ